MFRLRGPAVSSARAPSVLGHSLGIQDALNRRAGVTTANVSSSSAGGNMQIGSLVTGINLEPLFGQEINDEVDMLSFPPVLMRIYRDMYYYDSVVGATFDLYAQLPFGTYTLSKLDEKMLNVYQQTLERLSIETLFPQISIDRHVQGAFIGSMIYHKQTKSITDLLCLTPEDCDFTFLPLYGQDPIIEYRPPDRMKKFMSSKNPRAVRTQERMGKMFDHMKKGKVELDPLNTLFLPRRTLTSRPLGTSALKRILPIYLVEKSLWRGTLIESSRRIRSILHLIVGNDTWDPTNDDMQAISNLFTNADADPLGAIVATRDGIQTAEIRAGGEFWNIFNIWGETTPAKLRALGVSESFLSGDASYSTMEQSVTTFMENLRAHREETTQAVLYNRIFPLIALTNGFIKDKKLLPMELQQWKKGSKEGGISREDIARALTDTRGLHIPELIWTKTLEPRGDPQLLDTLNTLSEKGVPIHLATWAAAGGLDLNEIKDGSEREVADRKWVAEFKKKIGGGTVPEGDGEGGGDEISGEFSDNLGLHLKRKRAQDARHRMFGAGSNLMGLLGRDYGEMSELRQPTKSGSGWRPILNQKRAKQKINELAAKVITKKRKEEGEKHVSKNGTKRRR